MKRLSDLQRQAERAREAMASGAWWDGKRWHRPNEAPRRRRKGEHGATYLKYVQAWVKRQQAATERYQSGADVLLETLNSMMGDGPVDGPSRLQHALRFGQAFNARTKKDPRKDESQDVWATLHARFGARLLTGRIDKKLIASCLEELARGRYRTRNGSDWTDEGMKSLLRRERARL